MEDTSKRELVVQYLSTVEPPLTDKEVAYSQRLFDCSEDERLSKNISGYSPSVSSALCASISEKLGFADVEDDPSPDALYGYFLVEYLLWEENYFGIEEQKFSADIRAENDYTNTASSVITVDFLRKQPVTKDSIYEALNVLRSQVEIYTEDNEDEAVDAFCQTIPPILREVALRSSQTLEKIVLSLLEGIAAFDKESVEIECSLEEDLALHEYCRVLLSSFQLNHKLTPEKLLYQSAQDITTGVENLGVNQTSVVKYAALNRCRSWLRITSSRLIRERRPQRLEDGCNDFITQHIQEICKFLAQSVNPDRTSVSLSNAVEVAYMGRRYYELLYKNRLDAFNQDAIEEFSEIIDDSIQNGPLSFILDEIDRLFYDSHKDLRSDSVIQKGIVDFEIKYASKMRETPSARSSRQEVSLPPVASSISEKTRGAVLSAGFSSSTMRPQVEDIVSVRRCASHPSEPCRGAVRFSGQRFKRRSLSLYDIRSVSMKFLGVAALLTVSSLGILFNSVLQAASRDSDSEVYVEEVYSVISSESLRDRQSYEDLLVSDSYSSSFVLGKDSQLDSMYFQQRSNIDFLKMNLHQIREEDSISSLIKTLKLLKGERERESFNEQTETYLATWYGSEAQGQLTASGESFDAQGVTIAHPSLPFNTHVELHNPLTNESVTARVTDRPSDRDEHHVVLSYEAAKMISIKDSGRALVELLPLTW